MRRVPVILIMLVVMLAVALPALAEEGDPLANSVLLPSAVGWGMAALAAVLMVLFILWARRGPQ